VPPHPVRALWTYRQTVNLRIDPAEYRHHFSRQIQNLLSDVNQLAACEERIALTGKHFVSNLPCSLDGLTHANHSQ